MRAQPAVARWRVEFTAPLPAAGAEEYAENASIALRVVAADPPSIVSADSARLGDHFRVVMISAGQNGVPRRNRIAATRIKSPLLCQLS